MEDFNERLILLFDAIWFQKVKAAFRPTSKWGPRDYETNQKYKEMLSKLK